ncbi:MAG TPA: M20/M25/M40 family metallo-hydrolase, partial [Ktedonobacteraceae bacterium]|nr:M20/M25/M40 family metallo-hydrolase [Ktedonobacteraceae bacterium]
MYTTSLTTTLIDLIRIPSTSGHEEKIRAHLAHYLAALGLSTTIDGSGNLISTLTGEGTPLLLNAHMDRVPPGLGHQPVLRNGVLYSDGTTNLGADDAAGIAIILEVIRRTIEQGLPHPPLLIVFTVQEEAGLCGASNFDSARWDVADGIVFDNAFEAGVVVSEGAAYEAFDIEIAGRTGHPGKDLAQTIHAIEIFRSADYPHGSFDNDQTRVNIGRIIGGSARNAIPDKVIIEGELRSFEPFEVRQKYKQAIQDAFEQAAGRLGGKVNISFKTHSDGYKIDPEEPLLHTYRTVLGQRGLALQMKPTFIGSDTSGFRPVIRAFTVSTGVVHEHSIDEYVAIDPLEQLVIDTLQVLTLWSKHRKDLEMARCGEVPTRII